MEFANSSNIDGDAVKTPTHTRSHSDPNLLSQPQLSPSPKFKEPPPKLRDDNVIISTPSKLPGRANREALVLQMPTRDPSSIFQPLSGRNTPAYSPQTERETFDSPTSVLPRHSRGLDFSRACTNLHHSTVPDQSTPDSSPKMSHKSMKIPSRRQSNISSMALDSPRTSNTIWDRSTFRPRSLGSTTAMTSDASSSDSDSDVDMRSRYDPDDILATPVMNKHSQAGSFTPYTNLREDTIRGGAKHGATPESRRFEPYRRTPRIGGRLAALRTQHLSTTDDSSSSNDANDMAIDSPSRRPSITAGTTGLQISTGNPHSTGNNTSNDSDTETSPATFRFNSPPVVRRPVTRRSNLLPKTKGFARIRAQLQEEASPVDSDVRRDAEVVRQVRVGSAANSFLPSLSHQSTASSSPDLTPTIPNMPVDTSDMTEMDGLGVTLPTTEIGSQSATVTAMDEEGRRRSSNQDRYPHLFPTMTTPPPFPRHRSSSGISSEDTRMSSPAISSLALSQLPSATANTDGESQSSFPTPQLPSAADITRKANAKRRRDDDYFDTAGLKRRAVSPGLSVQSSPVMGLSPVSSTGGWWQSKERRENSGGSTNAMTPNLTGMGTPGGSQEGPGRAGSQDAAGREVRSASISSTSAPPSAVVVNSASAMAPPSTPNLGARRVGLQQGMSDTSEGLVKMSLE